MEVHCIFGGFSQLRPWSLFLAHDVAAALSLCLKELVLHLLPSLFLYANANKCCTIPGRHAEDGQDTGKDIKTAGDADESGEVCAAEPAPLFSFPFG